MATTLTKGANVALALLRPNVRRVLVGLGWSPPSPDYQVDLSVLLCGDDGQVPSPDYVVFASQLAQAGPAPAANPGYPDSGSSGDREQIEVDLAHTPPYIDKIVFAASIYSAAARRQTFGQIANLYIHVADLDSGDDLVRYPLDHDCAGETAMAFGELYRHSSGWKFRAVGQGWSDGLAGLTRDYGAEARR